MTPHFSRKNWKIERHDGGRKWPRTLAAQKNIQMRIKFKKKIIYVHNFNKYLKQK